MSSYSDSLLGLELFWRAGEVVPLRSDRRLISPLHKSSNATKIPFEAIFDTIWLGLQSLMYHGAPWWFDLNWSLLLSLCVCLCSFLCVCMCARGGGVDAKKWSKRREGSSRHQQRQKPATALEALNTGLMAREIDNRGFIWTTVWWIWEDFV